MPPRIGRQFLHGNGGKAGGVNMNPARPTHLLRCLLSDNKGASVMETALVVPLLAVFVAGACDMAMGYAQKIKVQQAAARSIEMVTTARVGSTAFTALQSEAAGAAGVSTSNVTVDSWLECNGTRTGALTANCTNSSDLAGRFVSVSINGSYAPMFSFLIPQSHLINGAIKVTGYSSVRVQ